MITYVCGSMSGYPLLTDEFRKDIDNLMMGGDKKQIDQALVKLGDYPIYIDDTAVINPVTMKSKIQQLISAGTPPELVIVDYLQLVTMQGMGGRSRNEEVSDISRNLKLLAKEFQVPIIALSQLNRKAEERNTPQISDLAESDGIARDADTVMFVDRPDYHPGKKDNNTPSAPEDDGVPAPAGIGAGIVAEPAFIYLSKNRHGKTGRDSVWWIPSKTLFYEPNGKDPVEPGSEVGVAGGAAGMSGAAGDVSVQPSQSAKTTGLDAASQNDPSEDNDEPEAPLSEEEEMEQAHESFMADAHDDFPEGFM